MEELFELAELYELRYGKPCHFMPIEKKKQKKNTKKETKIKSSNKGGKK